MRPSALVSLSLLLAACGAGAAPPSAAREAVPAPSAPLGYQEAIVAIAADIEALAASYPQLADFTVAANCDRDELVISYGYRTHAPRGGGGWAGAVPNPDDDGVWFHLDFHDPASTRQIHTQPVVPDRRYLDKKVMLLILEGAQTRPLAGELERIMRARGVTGR